MTKSKPPGPTGLPLLGSVFPWLRNQPRFLLETYRRYGEVVRFEFLGFHGAILHGAEANRYILIDAVDNFQVGPVIDRARARWIVGQGILFIDEPEHRQQRRLLLPSIHRKRIETYQQVMREVTTQILDCWQSGLFTTAHCLDDGEYFIRVVCYGKLNPSIYQKLNRIPFDLNPIGMPSSARVKRRVSQ